MEIVLIDTLIDGIKDNGSGGAGNLNNGLDDRIKKYQIVPYALNCFDNHLRTNFKKLYFVYVKYMILFTVLTMFILNGFEDMNLKNNFIQIGLDLQLLGEIVFNNILNLYAEKINYYLLEFELTSFITIFEIPNTNLELMIEAKIFFIVLSVLIFIRFYLVWYSYYTSKILFNAGFTHLYINPILFYHFFKRLDNNYLYVKNLPHQKSTNISKQNEVLILKHLFEIEFDPSSQIVEFTLTPKKLFYLFDYQIFSYKIKDKPKKGR